MYDLRKALMECNDAEFEERFMRHSNKPTYFGGQTRLPRFSRYELVGLDTTPFFTIVPTIDARIEWYRPFEHEPLILRDYLNVLSEIQSPKTDLARKIVKNASRYCESSHAMKEADAVPMEAIENHFRRDFPSIAAFCEKWGPLNGRNEEQLNNRYYLEKSFLGGGPQILAMVRREFGRNAEEELKATEGPFNDWVIHVFRNFVPRYKGEIQTTWTRGAPLAELEQQLCRIVLGFMFQAQVQPSNPISQWYQAGELEHLRDWQIFTAGKFNPHEFYGDGKTIWMDKLTNGSYAAATRISICHTGDQWKLDYEVDNLLSALRIMLIHAVTGISDQIKICALKECGKAFIARDPRANYCKPEHSNLGRVRRYRESRKPAQKTVVKSVVELSTKQGKTRGKRGKA